MTPTELSRQEEHLFAVLSGKRFLQMEGLSNEVPFFIYPYDPEDALAIAGSKKRIKNRLANKGIEVREISSAASATPRSLTPWAHVNGTAITYPASEASSARETDGGGAS